MSQFRLARISLMLAVLGLNAAPALVPAALAEDKPAAAEAPKEDVVRSELFKLIDPTVILELLKAEKFAEVAEKLKAAEVFTDLTPFESYILNRMKLSLGAASKNDPMTMAALEAVIKSGRLQGAEHDDLVQLLANYHYNAKDYPKAIEWMQRYKKESATPLKIHGGLARAYYQIEDYAQAKELLLPVIGEAEKAGKVPEQEDLRLLVASAGKVKDMTTYVEHMEKLVKFYPSEEFWADLLSRMVNKQTFDVRLQLDAYRLQHVALSALTDDEYLEMAELALLAGYPTEAKMALDAGDAAAVFGAGPNAAVYKQLRSKANKDAADDIKNIDKGEASAVKAKDGLPLVNLGFAYVTMGQFDKGIALMEQGIAKGVKKRPEDAKLHLGVAYAKAGRKDDAIKVFEAMKGTDGLTDLGKYWILWLNRPVKAADAAAPAAAK